MVLNATRRVPVGRSANAVESAGVDAPTALPERSMSQYTLDEFSGSGSDGECPTCGEVFKNRHGMRIHHAQAHGESLAYVEKTCAVCGAEYETLEIRADGSGYCSNACKHEGRRDRVEKTCGVCGETFVVQRSLDDYRRHCSLACRAEAQTGVPPEEHNAWKGGPVTVTCEWCDGAFEVKAHQAGRRKTCSRECHFKWRSTWPRERHPRYRGGAPGFYETVRRFLSREGWPTTAARVRENADGCEMCGAEACADGRGLHVHHIVPVLGGGTNDDDLLIPLCNVCHQKAEAFTDRFIPPIISAKGDGGDDA